MAGNDVSRDHLIAALMDMGFELEKSVEAIETVGLCLDDALEFILNGSCDGGEARNGRVSRALDCSTSQVQARDKRAPSIRLRQLNITDHISSSSRIKKSNFFSSHDGPFSSTNKSKRKHACMQKVPNCGLTSKLEPGCGSVQQDPHIHVNVSGDNAMSEKLQQSYCSPCQQIELELEQKVGIILEKHFGFSSLKSFQKEALEAWSSHRDCLVLAATGSGKSLCFQIPALLSGKIVLVISPLISLMHDQCLKLAKHGVSACFLGSGQPDNSIEFKAMNGVYKIIYVCPETVLRLIEPLKRLAENHGIALFAIDEVHCVSKWGHDFRPDYRRLSILRDNFTASKLKFLEFDIPLMALTATATIPVREDIIKSLKMSRETRIILTSFFRPNLQFSVKHSRTSSVSSYKKDFHELIKTYATERKGILKGSASNDIDNSENSCESADDTDSDDVDELLSDKILEGDGSNMDNYDEDQINNNSPNSSAENELTVEYLEDDLDAHHHVDDLDVPFGEFIGEAPSESSHFSEASKRARKQASLEHGPTIIYVPTRKETLKLAEHLSRSGVRAAAYHAKLPKSHLRHVHEEFHHDALQIVVATIAFGMGIDKSNVRRIIHYGWPQSLEAYYQEAGRAGRDGKLSQCTLYANLSRIPTLLPSQRSEEQTRQAHKMLFDAFRYGMNTSKCRAKTLVNYFGEEFIYDGCNLCDVCVAGPPRMQNFKEEAVVLLQALKAEYARTRLRTEFNDDVGYGDNDCRKLMDRPNFKMLVSKIREQFQKFSGSDRLWWQGLARMLRDKGYIREGNGLAKISIKYPELTEIGLRFLHSESEQTFYAYPEADMLLSMEKPKPFSTFSEWGRGWADPGIRRQRLQRLNQRSKSRKWKRKRHSNRHHRDLSTVRGRLTAKFEKLKRYH